MKLPEYQREWRGVEFDTLGVPLGTSRRADSAFYQAFYAALQARGSDTADESSWRAAKDALGGWIEERILRPLGKPRLISLGAGEAIAERLWMRRGYRVDLNECQAQTLEAAKAEFPETNIFMGEAYAVSPPRDYDLAIMLTVDYALTDQQLEQAFTAIRRSLKEGGMLLNYTANTLTALQAAKEFVKRCVLFRYNDRHYIGWGWARTPGTLDRIANRAGLRPMRQFMRRGNTFRERHPALRMFPPLREREMITLYTPSEN